MIAPGIGRGFFHSADGRIPSRDCRERVPSEECVAVLLLHADRARGRFNMKRLLLALLLGFLVAFSLGARLRAQAAGPPTAWRISEAPADLKPAINRADTYIAAQHSALLRQLVRALGDGGPARAIQQCHLEATNNANWIGRQQGYAIGRTGDRLRSPTNKPKPWAAPIVREYAGRQAAAVEGFAVDLGDRVGVMRPIAMRAMCEGCHGSADKISPGVRKVLEERYPVDRAIGFKPGEIRGWYWTEIPKAAR
jgi:hypothetical protein